MITFSLKSLNTCANRSAEFVVHCSVTKSCPILWPHGPQHARFLCPSLSPGACSNSCPFSWWCHPTISSSVTLCSCPQYFPASRVFSNELALSIRWPKYWSFSINPSNEHSGLFSFRIDWLDLLSVHGTLKETSLIPQFKSINSSALSFLYGPTLTSIHDYWENHKLWLDGTFLAK